MSVLIKDGTVLSPAGGIAADVLVEGERIAALLQAGAMLGGSEIAADRVIDATGKYVVPGGIDVHTHMQLPFGGTEASDTFETGTRAAPWGGKGVIAPGSDADVVIYNPSAKTTIGVATHHMNLDHSAYEGFLVDGGVDTVLSRGSVVIENGMYSGRAGHGRFLERGLSQYLV